MVTGFGHSALLCVEDLSAAAPVTSSSLKLTRRCTLPFEVVAGLLVWCREGSLAMAVRMASADGVEDSTLKLLRLHEGEIFGVA